MDKEFERIVQLISTQLDAASSLIAFAAADLKKITGHPQAVFQQELRMILSNLEVTAASLRDNAALIAHLDTAEDEDEQDIFDIEPLSSGGGHAA